MPQGYKSANMSDRIKHANLTELVRALAPRVYVELHSGAGHYNGYDGSAIRVMKTHPAVRAFLHEKNPQIRKALELNVSSYPNASVTGDWRDDIVLHIVNCDSSYLFMSDPTKIADYPEVIKYTLQILPTGACFFMYVPETLRIPAHQQIVDSVYGAILQSSRQAIDLMHPTPQSGYHARIEHNIVVADASMFPWLLEHHEELLRQHLTANALQGFKPVSRKV